MKITRFTNLPRIRLSAFLRTVFKVYDADQYQMVLADHNNHG